jgi:hypothetical protein
MLYAPSVQAAPSFQLWLPTPLGERWKVIQGFYCGTHTGSLARSLDLVNAEGSTYGAPVRASADGTTFFWTPASGTLILSHGNGYYTQYTHVINPIATRPGVPVKQGDVIAQVSDVATPGNPHLHYVFFRATGPYAAYRQGLELNFADGYSFRDTSGCNQHYGREVVAQGPDTMPPMVEFSDTVEPEQWYCTNERIEFAVQDDRLVHGFNQAFHDDPGGDAPEFLADVGYAELEWAGEGLHTFFVRAWDVNGHQTVESFGPVGYDATPPRFEVLDPVPVMTYTKDLVFDVAWTPAHDGQSGIEGYKLYLGEDPLGTSEWFNKTNQVTVGPLPMGRYVLRAQAIDQACGESEWITLQEMVVVDEQGRTPTPTTAPPTATPTATAPPTATPTATEEPAEATVTPTATEEPAEATVTLTATEEPAEATATPTPTATEAATATAES